MEVRVYWHLHKRCFSVKHKGKVIGHAKRVMLKAARFLVSEAGRQRVLRTGHKNVHAYVCGFLCRADWLQEMKEGDKGYDFRWRERDCFAASSAGFASRKYGHRVTYNPRTMAQFHTVDDEGNPAQPVDRAKLVFLEVETVDGKPRSAIYVSSW